MTGIRKHDVDRGPDPAECVECHRPFRWRAPGEKGVEQGWYRLHEDGPKGARCADRGSCKRVAAELKATLF